MSFEHFCSRKNTFSVGVTGFGEFCLPFLFLCPASTEDNHNRLLPVLLEWSEKSLLLPVIKHSCCTPWLKFAYSAVWGHSFDCRSGKHSKNGAFSRVQTFNGTGLPFPTLIGFYSMGFIL